MLTLLPQQFADACSDATFFGIPSWDTYLAKAGDVKLVTVSAGGTTTSFCDVQLNLIQGGKLNFGQLSLIGLGVLDILLYLAGLVAVGYVIFGGIQYVTSQGEPDKTKQAQSTVLNAVIGLGITIIAASVVSFIGNRIGG